MVLLRRIVAVPIVTALLVATPGRANGSERTFDVVVYGGTASGVMAAIAAAREGMHVALLEPTDHLGGMVTGGVSATDIGDRTAIGGLALELYGRAGKLYEMNRWGQNFAWRLEPSVAGRVLESMLAETSVELFMRQRLLEHQGAILKGRRIVAVRTMTGDTFSGRVFIDSTYEGDLMAAAGVSFTWGREPQEQYSEELAGARLPGDVWPPVSARRVRDDNLLYGVDGQPASQVGGADRRVQPYMFRLCVTTEPANRIPFSQPPDYREYRYALVSRYLSVLERWGRTPATTDFLTISPLPNGKADMNSGTGPITPDFIGGSYHYVNGDAPTRASIWNAHYRYQVGLLYFLTTDSTVPPALRQEFGRWGLCRDEFVATNNWPPQLYIREARRMVSDYVLTQRDVQLSTRKIDVIGLGSYRIDIHWMRRYEGTNGNVALEGTVNAPVPAPYDIPYRVLVPKRGEAEHLLVSVTASASHVAWGSLRMEPHFMVMGEAAGIAAAMAVAVDGTVQDIDVVRLQDRLLAVGARFEQPDRLSTLSSRDGLLLVALAVVIAAGLVLAQRARARTWSRPQ